MTGVLKNGAFSKATPRYAGLGRSLALFLVLFASTIVADHAVLLETAIQSAQARIELARSGDELYVGTYIIGNDTSGMETLALLREAARRGVKVHFLADAFQNHMTKGMMKHLMEDPASKGNFDIRVYHPISFFRPGRFLYRMHSKWMIAVNLETGEVSAALGGRNLWDKSFGRTKDADRDMDIYVRGKAAKRALNYAKKLWESAHVAKPSGMDSVLDLFRKGAALLGPFRPDGAWTQNTKDDGNTWYPRKLERVLPAEVEASAARLDRAIEGLAANPLLKTDSPTKWHDAAIDVGHVQFLGDNPDTRRGTSASVLKLIREARQSLVIANPYPMLTREMESAIAEARKHGVEITLITNSSRSNNVKLAQAGYEVQVAEILNRGVYLYEYNIPFTIHEKFIVADGKRIYIGSFNLDPRSNYWNLENGIIFESTETAGQLTRVAERQIKGARRIHTPADLTTPLACDSWFTYMQVRVLENML
jgi:cardiolipin synthase C